MSSSSGCTYTSIYIHTAHLLKQLEFIKLRLHIGSQGETPHGEGLDEETCGHKHMLETNMCEKNMCEKNVCEKKNLIFMPS